MAIPVCKAPCTERWYIGSYRHAQPYPKGNLYQRIRKLKGHSLKHMSALFGINWHSWRYRERGKRMYHIGEILALHEISELNAEQFIELLKEVA